MKPMKLNHEYGIITMRKLIICPHCLCFMMMATRRWAINPDHQEVSKCPNCCKKFVVKHGKNITKDMRDE